MLKGDFEKHIKDNLESAHFSWDKEEMWSDIEKQLPRKSRRRFFLWLWPLCLLVVFVGGIVVGKISQENSHQIVNQFADTEIDLSKNDQINVNEAEFIESPEEAPIQDQLNASIYKNQNTLISSSIPQISSGHSSSSPFVENLSISIFRDSDEKVFELSDHSQKRVFNNDKYFGDGLNSLVKFRDENETQEISRFLSLTPIQIIPSWLHYDPSMIMPNMTMANINDGIIKVQSKPQNRMQLGFFGGASMVSRELKGNGGSEWESARLANEKVLESVHGSAVLRYYLKNDWYIGGGIEWRRINEQLNYLETEVSQTTITVDTARYFVNHTGNLQFVSDEVETVTTRSRMNQLYNHHDQILIPLQLGKRIGWNKFSLSVNTGPVLMVSNSFVGTMINSDLDLIRGNKISTSGNNLIHAFDFGLSGGLRVANGLDLVLAANYRHALSSISVDNVHYRKYGIRDLKLGLLINL